MDSERLEELLERGEENKVETQAIEVLRRRFEPITYEAEDILRAAKSLGIPEEQAKDECLAILTTQLKQATSAWRLPPREGLWKRFDEFLERKQKENLE